jgi:2-polyprenyl-6-methoxyphenol hydroxylase-like FAD-dependent oxidoreductase
MSSPSPPVSSLSVDVAIIGGGIAGSSLSLVLRRAGLEVALIERERTFRDRIRGEAIHPWGTKEVHTIGLRPLLDEAGAISLPLWTRYRDAEASTPYAWTDDFPDSLGGISVNHLRLQQVLLQEARDEGVRVFRPASAAPVEMQDGWDTTVSLTGGEKRLRARLLVGADGQRSATRTLIGGNVKRDPVHHHIGGMLVRGVDLPADSAHQAYHVAGFGLVYLQRDSLARAYYICPTEEAAELQGPSGTEAFMARVGALYPDGAFAQAEPAGPLGFFPNADLVSDRMAGRHAVLIGDAASANDPCQGHGLSLVFRDIRLLRDLVLDADIADVPERFASARKEYYSVLREHARWAAPLATETGEEIEALRAQIERAREAEPSAGGFASLFATGPDGLHVDEAARAHFYGEDLPGATVFGYPQPTPERRTRPVEGPTNTSTMRAANE